MDAFVRGQVAEHLPAHLLWVLDCCGAERLRQGYEGRVLRLWSIAIGEGRVAVFESPVERGRRRSR